MSLLLYGCFQSWGKELDNNNARITDFLESLEKFIGSLVGARDNMEGHVTLADTEFGYVLDELKGPLDYQHVGECYRVLLSFIPRFE